MAPAQVNGHDGLANGSTKYPSDDRILDGATSLGPIKSPRTCRDDRFDAGAVATKLVDDFNRFLAGNDTASLATLFHNEGLWRDHLCLTWDLRTLAGRDKIAKQLSQGSRLLRLDIDTSVSYRAPALSQIDVDGNVTGIRFFAAVATDVGSGTAVFRLVEDQPGDWRIFTLYTLLDKLKDFPEAAGARRRRGTEQPGGKNWLQQRTEELDFSNGNPAVLIIGAGQGGLALSARLKMLQVPTLTIDKVKRVGDSWRNRYSRLVLHDPVWYDHMPYIQFPASWPVFTPKDKIANFFESYAELMELNVWTSTELVSSSWDDGDKQWTVTLERTTASGHKDTYTLHPKHIVLATGASGLKNFPTIPGTESFKGSRLCHSSDFPGARPNSQGKRAVIIGCCNSAHDLAQDFLENGYDVTMVQRSSTYVVTSHFVVDMDLKELYSEESPYTVEDADRVFWSRPAPYLMAMAIQGTKLQQQVDKETLEGLEKAGFKVDMGPNQAGLFCKYLSRGGGYYIDVGASKLIAEGKIKVKQGQEIERIEADGVVFADGSKLAADEIVFATGYQNMRTQARAILGDEAADRMSDAWGFDAEGEMRAVWRRSGHPGAWLMGGNLAMARFYSRIVALQIKALLEGLASYDHV